MKLGEGGAVKANLNRIIKTTNIDIFLNCDDMTAEELNIIQLKEEKDTEDARIKKIQDEEEEEDPAWADIDVIEVKTATSTIQKGSTPT